MQNNNNPGQRQGVESSAGTGRGEHKIDLPAISGDFPFPEMGLDWKGEWQKVTKCTRAGPKF